MTDRRNRWILAVVGLLLLVGGGLAACLGGGVFGSDRADRTVFDPTVVRWWNEGDWKSFAVVVAIGVVGAIIGVLLVLSQLRRNGARPRTPTVTFPVNDGQRGIASLRAAALSHAIEADLETSPDIHGARVGLFGTYPDIEMRAVLQVSDSADLDALPDHVDTVLDRVKTTTGIRPQPITVTVGFTSASTKRQVA